MKKTILKAVITGGKDDFGTWLEDFNVFGAGETVEEAKQSLYDGLSLYIEENKDIPKVLQGEYEIKFTFDTSGFLKYYSKFISFAAMKEITGIHQKQLWSYANGYRNPNKETAEKIFSRLKNFAHELGHVQIRF